MPGFGNVTLTPLTELEANLAAMLNDGLGLGFYHFEAQVKLGEILFEIERQLVVTAFGIGEHIADIADAHGTYAMRRDGENASLEVVASGPLDESRIPTFARFFFKALATLVLFHHDAIDHRTVDVQRVAADGGTHRERKIEIPGQGATERVAENRSEEHT